MTLVQPVEFEFNDYENKITNCPICGKHSAEIIIKPHSRVSVICKECGHVNSVLLP